MLKALYLILEQGSKIHLRRNSFGLDGQEQFLEPMLKQWGWNLRHVYRNHSQYVFPSALDVLSAVRNV